MNAPYPGVSMMFSLIFFHSRWQRAEEMLTLRTISSSSKSVTVVPWSTRPRRLTVPEENRREEVREVLPEEPCPMMPKLRISEIS
jgi:hypothetical protein